jgi:hypothetical protein
MRNAWRIANANWYHPRRRASNHLVKPRQNGLLEGTLTKPHKHRETFLNAMDDTCQIDLPASFLALHMRPGRSAPDLPWAELFARYELCEAMATMLQDKAVKVMCELRITEKDVLERCYRGLLQQDEQFTSDEATWVGRRLTELLGQPDTMFTSIVDQSTGDKDGHVFN